MTQPLRLHLSARHADVIAQEAERAYPRECCGLLIGEGEGDVRVCNVVPVDNVSENPERAFAVDPQRQFDLLRATRGTSQRVVGHYHSHPHSVAAPSAYDLAMAHDPDALWVIISGMGELRAFQRPEGASAFTEVPVVILG